MLYNDFIWFMRDDTSNEIFAWFCIPFISSIIDTLIMQFYYSTIIETKIKSYFPADINYIVYGRGDSINGNPTVSWQRLCAIDRVKLKVTKSSVKS